MPDEIESTLNDVERPRVIQFRLRTLLILILVFSLLFAIGVRIRERLNRQPTARVVVTYPGATVESCDGSVARTLELAFMSSPHIDSWTIVSHPGRVVAYAIAVRGTDSQDLPRQVDQIVQSLDGLPFDVVTKPSKLFRSKPYYPPISVQQVDQLSISFSREALAQQGLTIAEAYGQFQGTPFESSDLSKRQDLGQFILTTNHGERIELRQVAEIGVVQKPDKVVRQSQ